MQQAYVEPNRVGFSVPCLGGEEAVVTIRIHNPTTLAITFRVRLTRPERFRLTPVFGFVEPESNCSVRIKPSAFDAKPQTKNDRFTVLVADAPLAHGEHKAKDMWTGINTALRPVQSRRLVINIVYVNPGDPLPPRLPDRSNAEPVLVPEEGNSGDSASLGEEVDGQEEL